MTLTRTNWPDVDDVVALNADTEVMRYLDHGRPMTPARVLAEEMPRLMAHNGRADRLGSWVARDRGTGNFLGWFMITPVDEPLRNVELTYRLRRRAWGRGYDIEGMLCMIEIARAAQVVDRDRHHDGGRRCLAPTDGEGGPASRPEVSQ